MKNRSIPRRRVTIALCIAAVTCTVLATGPATMAQSPITTLTTGLNSPRGLGFSPTGDLVVVEAGDGSAPCTAGQNTMSLPPRNAPICVNRTGALSRMPQGSSSWERVQANWPSWRSNVPNQAFAEVTGPQDISFPFLGRAFVSVGWGGTPAARAGGPARGRTFGWLVKTGPSGGRTSWADIASFEQAWNPAGGPVDSNPYGVLAEKGRTFVADAGANALYRVQGRSTSLVATFPPTTNPGECRIPTAPGLLGPPAPPSSEPVPTTVARGPDGALYVGELTGFPFCAGAARIWRVPDGGQPTVYLTGFKSIIDLAFAKDGTLFVLQYASSPSGLGGPGQIVRVSPNGERTVLPTGTTLQQPAGVAVGPSDGALYVTNKTVTPGRGEVLRITP